MHSMNPPIAHRDIKVFMPTRTQALLSLSRTLIQCSSLFIYFI